MSDAQRDDDPGQRTGRRTEPLRERADRAEEGRAEDSREQARQDEAARAAAAAEDERLDEEARESFPASDPPSHTGITGEGRRGR